jgi:thioesterase domain-containing protein
VLGVDHSKIGVNDNFFDLGGNSLTILKVKNKIKSVLEYEVLLSALFLYPTIKELASNIKEESILNELECVVRLNRGNNKKNMFIIHPRHGMVYQYKELARLLESDYNVYAVQARGISGPSVLPPDVKTAAVDYVNQITKVQTEGPFIIVGYCAGDIIGYAMVKLLENLGHKVDKFVMLDEEPWLTDEILDYYHTKRQMSQISKPWQKVSSLFKKKNPEEQSPLEEYEKIIEEIKAREEQIIDKKTGQLTPEEEQKLQKRYRMNYRKIMTKYSQASPYGGKIDGIINASLIDIKAEKSETEKFDVRLLNRMTYGKFTLESAPGDHDNLFVEPAVSRIAEILRKM